MLSRIKTIFGTLTLSARKIANEPFRSVPGHTSRPYPDLADVEAGDEAIECVSLSAHTARDMGESEKYTVRVVVRMPQAKTLDHSAHFTREKPR